MRLKSNQCGSKTRIGLRSMSSIILLVTANNKFQTLILVPLNKFQMQTSTSLWKSKYSNCRKFPPLLFHQNQQHLPPKHTDQAIILKTQIENHMKFDRCPPKKIIPTSQNGKFQLKQQPKEKTKVTKQTTRTLLNHLKTVASKHRNQSQKQNPSKNSQSNPQRR